MPSGKQLCQKMKNSANTGEKKKIMGHGSVILFLENSPGYVIA